MSTANTGQKGGIVSAIVHGFTDGKLGRTGRKSVVLAIAFGLLVFLGKIADADAGIALIRKVADAVFRSSKADDPIMDKASAPYSPAAEPEKADPASAGASPPPQPERIVERVIERPVVVYVTPSPLTRASEGATSIEVRQPPSPRQATNDQEESIFQSSKPSKPCGARGMDPC